MAHPEGAVGDVVAATEQEAEDGDGVGEVEEDDAGGYHARTRGVVRILLLTGGKVEIDKRSVRIVRKRDTGK